jgi:hypothetical protein
MSPILGIYASQITGKLVTGSYESIQTVTVGSGGAASVTFSSIPSTYTHLQIRGIARGTVVSTETALRNRFNGDSGSNYTRHDLRGNGTTATSAAATSADAMNYGDVSAASSNANVFGVFVGDVLDYANTNKYKTIRSLNGFDNNGDGQVGIKSGFWRNTAAVTEILIFPASGDFTQYSTFALYGIKG